MAASAGALRRPHAALALSLTLLAFCAGASASIEAPGGAPAFWQNKAGQPVPDQWIVVFNDHVSSPEEGLRRRAPPARLTTGTRTRPDGRPF